MQKYLLTLAAAALAAGTMMAEDTTLSVASATDIQGTFTETQYKADGSGVQAAAHYQPLESLKIGDFAFTFGTEEGFSSEPALYMNNEATTPVTIRLYKLNVMTISFPAETKVGSITWNFKSLKGLDNITVSSGEASVDADAKTLVWNNSAEATTVTFTMPSVKGSDGNNPNVQIESFTVSAEGAIIIPDNPVNPGDNVYEGLFGSNNWEFENVVLPETLDYVWSWDSKYNCIKASAYKDNKSLASEAWAISPVIDLTEVEAPVVDFQHAVGPKGMSEAQSTYFRENCGFFVREEGGEWAQLTIANWPVDWTFVAAGEISLADYAGKKIQLGAKYMSTDEISVTWELKEVVVKDANTGVAVVADENAPAVYFDLNGRRVAEPANGLFIKVQGNKTSKVIIK